jgi:fimbrial chaperone protein
MACCAGLAGAQAIPIAVAPVVIKMDIATQFSAVEVGNRGDQATGIEAEIVRVRWVNGREEYEPTKDFLVSPPAFLLPAHKSRLVRFRFGNTRDDSEGFYRLFVRQLAEQEGPANQINMVFKLGVPIFVAPLVSRPALALFDGGISGTQVKNSGNVTLTLSQLDGEKCSEGPLKMMVRLAPDQTIALLPAMQKCVTRALTDRGTLPLSTP